MMHFINQPIKKRRRDEKRGNGGRYKSIVYQVGYKEHKQGNGYCVWAEGLTGWSPTGGGYPITETEAIKLGKEIAKENKAEWIEKI